MPVFILTMSLHLSVVAASSKSHFPEMVLTLEQANQFARLALKGILKEYPNKPADVLNGDDDVKKPREMHPAFYGCYDWHSAVHGHWMLIRLLKHFPNMPLQQEIRSALAANLTAKIAETLINVECYFVALPRYR